MEDKKKLTEDITFELGKVTIGGDAVKVEDSLKEEEEKKDNDKQTSNWKVDSESQDKTWRTA